ncbi:NAD-binding protein, partial [Aquiflexum sp.]|uniref:NAD-binding protein n=1 Tax=Aquiflexum sp. TaxID=1872584 RepID=UPI0035932057
MGMNIVIAGAGDMGYHLAKQLSFENRDIILIDLDKDALDNASSHLDVLTIMGDATSLEILKSANVREASMFMAVTTSEKTNLLAAALAKQLGAKRVIARVRNHDFLHPENEIYFKNIGIDNIISPS